MSFLQGFFLSALDKYAALTKKDLVNDPLVAEIRSCATPAAICVVLQQHVQGFPDHYKLMTCIGAIIDNLHVLSATPALSEVRVTNLQVVSPRDSICLYRFPKVVCPIGVTTRPTCLFRN